MGIRMVVRVFEVNDCEWWAGDGSAAEVLAAYMEVTGTSHEEATGDVSDWPRPLSDAEMERLKFAYDGELGRLEQPHTFREELDRLIAVGTSFPCFFATTEV